MSTDQIILFSLLGAVFALLIWGRWRYDLVAFAALVAAVIAGVVPTDKAFEGFGHPATIIIALVLIVSRGLSNSGAVDLIANFVISGTRSLSAHIGIISAVGAALSAIMNNVGALALLMPVDIQAAHKAKRSPALTLMPLSFATMLGGLVTLIGTPPNIIIASFRAGVADPTNPAKTLGPFQMFDFAPVGAACALAGVLFVTLIGWRLIPAERKKHDLGEAHFQLDEYIAEVRVPDGSSAIGQQVRGLDETCEDCDVVIAGLVRGNERMPGQARLQTIHAGDILVLEAAPKAIDEFVGKLKLEYVGQEQHSTGLAGEDLSLMEVVVPPGARIEGRSALSLRLLYNHGVTLLGVSRQGRRFRERVRKLTIRAGDVLLLYGRSDRLAVVAD